MNYVGFDCRCRELPAAAYHGAPDGFDGGAERSCDAALLRRRIASAQYRMVTSSSAPFHCKNPFKRIPY